MATPIGVPGDSAPTGAAKGHVAPVEDRAAVTGPAGTTRRPRLRRRLTPASAGAAAVLALLLSWCGLVVGNPGGSGAGQWSGLHGGSLDAGSSAQITLVAMDTGRSGSTVRLGPPSSRLGVQPITAETHLQTAAVAAGGIGGAALLVAICSFFLLGRLRRGHRQRLARQSELVMTLLPPEIPGSEGQDPDRTTTVMPSPSGRPEGDEQRRSDARARRLPAANAAPSPAAHRPSVRLPPPPPVADEQATSPVHPSTAPAPPPPPEPLEPLPGEASLPWDRPGVLNHRQPTTQQPTPAFSMPPPPKKDRLPATVAVDPTSGRRLAIPPAGRLEDLWEHVEKQADQPMAGTGPEGTSPPTPRPPGMPGALRPPGTTRTSRMPPVPPLRSAPPGFRPPSPRLPPPPRAPEPERTTFPAPPEPERTTFPAAPEPEPAITETEARRVPPPPERWDVEPLGGSGAEP